MAVILSSSTPNWPTGLQKPPSTSRAAPAREACGLFVVARILTPLAHSLSLHLTKAATTYPQLSAVNAWRVFHHTHHWTLSALTTHAILGESNSVPTLTLTQVTHGELTVQFTAAPRLPENRASESSFLDTEIDTVC